MDRSPANPKIFCPLVNLTILFLMLLFNQALCTKGTAQIPMQMETFSLSGVVFNDINGNGNMDNNGAGLGNWKVNLEQAGTVIANTTTEDVGSYSFPGLLAGDYIISDVLEIGWKPIGPADGKISVSITHHSLPSLNFGNKKVPQSGGDVF